jgi:hypothetical protein
MIRHPLQFQGRLIAPQFPVQLIGTALVLQPQALMPFSRLVAAVTGPLRPLLELCEPLLQAGSSLGHFGVLHGRSRKTVIGVQSQRP